MKKILFGLTCLLVSSAVVFAKSTAPTDMEAKWTCTTNASTSDAEVDKSADEQMVKEQGSAVKSFEFAAKHCRDCTKITCEAQD